MECLWVHLQVEFYVQKAEAFLQLCDFQSAVLNLRKAYSLSSAKEEYVERMAFILYLQVKGTE